MRSLVVLAVFSHFGGCATQTQLPKQVRAAIQSRYAGSVMELRQSCYYGDLYDENEKWLLSPYPFASTFHIVDMRGAPIHPKGQRGIVPAGSRFKLTRIEFPDVVTMAQRMLTTPRYNPWIYLRPLPETPVSSLGRDFVLLLPMDLQTAEEVDTAILDLLAPKGRMEEFLGGLRPTVLVAVRHKEIVKGMTLDEVVAAMGSPQRWFTEVRDAGEFRVAWYPGHEAWMRDGVVVEVRAGRPADPVPQPVRRQ